MRMARIYTWMISTQYLRDLLGEWEAKPANTVTWLNGKKTKQAKMVKALKRALAARMEKAE